MIQADSYQLQIIAKTFGSVADSLREQSRQVERIRAGIMEGLNAWKGEGANAFSARCQILKYELDQSAKVLEDASSALLQLANRMEHVKYLRDQATRLESMAYEMSADNPEHSYSYFAQANAMFQEAEWEANSADAQAANAFAEAMAEIPNILQIRETKQEKLQDLLNSLPPEYRSYYERHQDLLAEEAGLDEADTTTKKRHVFLVGGIDPSDNVNELAINNLGEMLVDTGEADSYSTVDGFTPNETLFGVLEVAGEKIHLDRHQSGNLADMIEQYHREHSNEEIDIIAHSGGGEISKNADNELYLKGEGDYVNKIVTFGGADWTDPVDKQIDHNTSAFDIVGVPGYLTHELPKGLANVYRSLVGDRIGTEEKITLKENDQSSFDHIVVTTGDHVNYFEPGINLDRSYQNAVDELNSQNEKVVPTSPLVKIKNSLYYDGESVYYSKNLEVIREKLDLYGGKPVAYSNNLDQGVEKVDK